VQGPEKWGWVMKIETLLAIGKQLRRQNEGIAGEAMPRRWIDSPEWTAVTTPATGGGATRSAAESELKLCCKRSPQMWNTLWDEVREMVWLASLIAGLSALGVGLALALAAA
jgi:hypothetical protein